MNALPTLSGSLCCVVPATPPAPTGNIFTRAPPFDDTVAKARKAGKAARFRVLRHADLTGPALVDTGDLPFAGPPLVKPDVNPASALGGVMLSGSRNPDPNPFVSPEARKVYTTRAAAAQAAARSVEGGDLAEALAASGAGYTEVTVLSILGNLAGDEEWKRISKRYSVRGPELLSIQVPIEKGAVQKWMTTQYQNQALKGVALFANAGARPVNAKRGNDGEVIVLWETLTEQLRAEPAGSVVFTVKEAEAGVEISATRRGPKGDALAEPLANEDDLIRSFTELLNRKFPSQAARAPMPVAAAPAPVAPVEAKEAPSTGPSLEPPRRRRE